MFSGADGHFLPRGNNSHLLSDRQALNSMTINKRWLAYHVVNWNAEFMQKLVGNYELQQFINSRKEPAQVLPEEYGKRYLIYDFLNRDILNNCPISFLEFGVFRGESLRHWSSINTDPASRFVGFDCFEGLPEDWGKRTKGAFNVDGKIPDIDDERVSFVVGFFQHTLGSFLAKANELDNRLVIHLDADLYSSTLYCLTMLDHLIKPGTVVIFDEFSDVRHEFSAFYDYVRSYLREFTILCHTPNYGRIAVEFK